MKKTHGFTLIEIILVVAIITVLTTIAVPAFTTYKQKSVLGAATSFMLTVSSKQQDYLLTNRQYALDGGTTGLQKLNIDIAAEETVNDNFTVTIGGGTNPNWFIITLTPKARSVINGYGRAGDGGGTVVLGNTAPRVPLTLNSADQKTPAEFW